LGAILKHQESIILSHGTECYFGKMKERAEAINMGKPAINSGILVGIKDGKPSLNPAMQRDPKAPFKP